MQLGIVFIVGCALAFGASWLCHRRESDPSLKGDSATAMALTGAMLVLALVMWGPTVYAQFPVQDPCYGLEPDNPFYWLYGCFWPS